MMRYDLFNRVMSLPGLPGGGGLSLPWPAAVPAAGRLVPTSGCWLAGSHLRLLAGFRPAHKYPDSAPKSPLQTVW